VRALLDEVELRCPAAGPVIDERLDAFRRLSPFIVRALDADRFAVRELLLVPKDRSE
jgi:hypothetical protein